MPLFLAAAVKGGACYSGCLMIVLVGDYLSKFIFYFLIFIFIFYFYFLFFNFYFFALGCVVAMG